MDLNQLEHTLKQHCKQVMTPHDFAHIERLTFHAYDPDEKNLTLYAADATQALYVQQHYSHVLIGGLEEIVGAPARILCKVTPDHSKPHERFIVQYKDT